LGILMWSNSAGVGRIWMSSFGNMCGMQSAVF
jgi:hypothetical protein